MDSWQEEQLTSDIIDWGLIIGLGSSENVSGKH